MTFSTWIGNCKVDITNWIDGTHDHLNIACYQSGAALSRPYRERGFLIRKSEAQTVRSFLDTIRGILSNPLYWKELDPGCMMEISVSGGVKI